MLYDAHVYITCRVKVTGIEADSQEAAVDLAIDRMDEADIRETSDNGGSIDGNVEWCGYVDEITSVLIDEHGDKEFDRSRNHDFPTHSSIEKGLLNACKAAQAALERMD